MPKKSGLFVSRVPFFGDMSWEVYPAYLTFLHFCHLLAKILCDVVECPGRPVIPIYTLEGFCYFLVGNDRASVWLAVHRQDPFGAIYVCRLRGDFFYRPSHTDNNLPVPFKAITLGKLLSLDHARQIKLLGLKKASQRRAA